MNEKIREMTEQKRKEQRSIDQEASDCPEDTWRNALIIGVVTAAVPAAVAYFMMTRYLDVSAPALIALVPFSLIIGISAAVAYYGTKGGVHRMTDRRGKQFSGLFLVGMILVVIGVMKGQDEMIGFGVMLFITGVILSKTRFRPRRTPHTRPEPTDVAKRRQVLIVALALAGAVGIGAALLVQQTYEAQRATELVIEEDRAVTPPVTDCDESGGLMWCERLKSCVNPWIRPCDEKIDSSVLQRLYSIRQSTDASLSYPESDTLIWRSEVNNEIVQTEINALVMKTVDSPYDTIDHVVWTLDRHGFEQDLQNMADGPGAGMWGYQLGSTVCVMEFQATNLVLPSDPIPEQEEPLLFDISVSCGRL